MDNDDGGDDEAESSELMLGLNNVFTDDEHWLEDDGAACWNGVLLLLFVVLQLLTGPLELTVKLLLA